MLTKIVTRVLLKKLNYFTIFHDFFFVFSLNILFRMNKSDSKIDKILN